MEKPELLFPKYKSNIKDFLLRVHESHTMEGKGRKCPNGTGGDLNDKTQGH